MPQRTYTGIDLINYLIDFIPGADSPPTQITPSQGTASLFISEVDTVFLACNALLNISGDFDFDVFPAIPANALISEIDFSWEANITLTAEANNGAGDASVIALGICTPTLGATQLTDSQLLDSSGAVTGPGTQTANANASTAYTLHTVLPFAPPITKSELELDYGNILLALQIGLTADGNVATSITGTVGTVNFNLVITYEDGPVSGMTVTPASGNVQPGRIIVVTGPEAAEQEYFFETEDGIIPVEPQIIGPEEVWVEMPYPATDPCFDCFPSCPECEAAFAPCDADFGSSACQEAMQECLDCLTECLEDLQLAEECQESSHNPLAEPVPVVLVMGTQFSGNVPLGSFVILNTDGSGLYKFVLGQTHDTLYDGARDGTTYNVKIPNPGGKTGFFRS